MIGLLFCGTVVNYIDRVNISVAAPVIMKETGWDKGQFGLVFSAFLIGYALLQIPGGMIADRWGGRKVLALAFCGFSLFTALTPLGQSAFMLLLLMRFFVGAFESVTIPALTSLNSRWIPRTEFGRAQTLSLSGITVGQMIAYPLRPGSSCTGPGRWCFMSTQSWALSRRSCGYGTPPTHPRPTLASRRQSVHTLPHSCHRNRRPRSPYAQCLPMALSLYSL
jgi:MFS family permease